MSSKVYGKMPTNKNSASIIGLLNNPRVGDSSKVLLLLLCSESNGPHTVGEVANIFNLSYTRAGARVKELEREGYLSRKIIVTELGRKTVFYINSSIEGAFK